MGSHRQFTKYDRRLLDALTEFGPMYPAQLAQKLKITKPRNVYESLRKQEKMHLVTSSRQGRKIIYRATGPLVLKISNILMEYSRLLCITYSSNIYADIKSGDLTLTPEYFVRKERQTLVEVDRYDFVKDIVQLFEPGYELYVDGEDEHQYPQDRVREELDLMDDDEREAAPDVIGSPS